MSVGASKKSVTTFSLLGELAMKLGELVRSDTAVPPMPVKTSRRIPLVWAGSRCVAVTRQSARKIKCLMYDLAYYIANSEFGKFGPGGIDVECMQKPSSDSTCCLIDSSLARPTLRHNCCQHPPCKRNNEGRFLWRDQPGFSESRPTRINPIPRAFPIAFPAFD